MSEEAEEDEFLGLFGDQYGYSGQINRIRKQEFKRLEGITYLDHAGATQYPQSVIKSIHDDLTNNVYGNPHSRNPSSQLASDIVEQVRGRILRHFNTNLENHSVIFTAGATDALKLLAESFHWQAAVNKAMSQHRSCFCYLEENHTSVVGIREKAVKSGAQIFCVNENDFVGEKQDSHVKIHNLSNSETRDCTIEEHSECCCHNLLAFPAMCNFSGAKYPLEWVSQTQQGLIFRNCSPSCHWCVVLDAASFVSTSPLDLVSCTADFVPVSFYKMFGFPTGLGALIVKNSSSHVLRKCYYGGGTVQATISSERFHVLRKNLAEKFEDGTLPYLDIITLHHAFNVYEQLTGSMSAVLNHTYSLSLYTYNNMSAMKHSSGKPLCKIYCKTDFKDKMRQGPVINFNILRENGDFVGYSEVEKMASLYNIHVRTGCFCNTGACQQFLNLSNKHIKNNLSAGHVCGDDVDLIAGRPTGSVRISFGYMSNFADAKTFLNFLQECFLERHLLNDVSQQRASTTAQKGLPDIKSISNPVLTNHSRDMCNGYGEVKNDSVVTTDLPEMLQKKSNQANYCALDSNNIQSGLEQELPSVCLLNQKHSVLTHSTTTALEDSEASSSPYMYNSCRLEKIFLYPIKSCAAFEVDEWEIGHRGFVYDRQWMVVADSGICLTQKREPRLCLIKPTLDLVSGILSVTAPGMSTLVLPLHLPLGNETVKCKAVLCQTKVCGDRVSALDCGEEAAHWMSSFLNRNCRLIEHHKQDSRTCKLGGKQEENGSSSLSLANESQFLLITVVSTSELFTSVKTTLELEPQTVESNLNHLDKLINRFRANLVVNGEQPFAEDDWKMIKIGDLVFKNHGKCNRCQMVCIDQETGMKSSQPLKALGKLRGARMPFGIHLEHVTGGCIPRILHCGDVVSPRFYSSVLKLERK